MTKVLLIGQGAREHILGESFVKGGAQLFVFGKTRNPGLIRLAEHFEVGNVMDFTAVREFAKKIQPNLVFIGPDDPIGGGLADVLVEAGFRVVAPLQTVARLEASKSFTRDVIEKYELGVNPAFRTFYEPMGMREFMEKLDGNYVVKADGLMGGKGVKVSGEHLKSLDEGLAYAEECLIAAGKVVIEEKLIGQEFSLMSFADGVSTGVMPAIQDHKRAFEADFGPNTGGMGTYSYPDHSLPFLRLSEVQDAAEITQRLMKVLEEETGVQYKGIMYGGFIATKNGVKVIEYNARFGDPEALNALSLLNTNFVQVCDAIWNGDLGSLALDFAHKATVCKYVVPEGYPDEPRSGERIEIHELPTGVKLYFGNVDQKEDGLYLGSSRAVGLVGVADTIEEAEQLAEVGCGSVKGPVFHRKDIGTQPLIQKRVEMMKQIRG